MEDSRSCLVRHCFRIFDTLPDPTLSSQFGSLVASRYQAAISYHVFIVFFGEVFKSSFMFHSYLDFSNHLRQFLFLENVKAVLQKKEEMRTVMDFIVKVRPEKQAN